MTAEATTAPARIDPELFPDDQIATTAALLHAEGAIRAAFVKMAVEPAGLDEGTADLLVRLAKADDHSIRGVEIGRQCHMSPTRVSRLVDRAEAAGLVERLPDPDDRRAQQVALTLAGAEAAAHYAPLMAQLLDELIFETLTAAERETLIGLLDRVQDRAIELLEARPQNE